MRTVPLKSVARTVQSAQRIEAEAQRRVLETNRAANALVQSAERRAADAEAKYERLVRFLVDNGITEILALPEEFTGTEEAPNAHA